MLGKCAGINIPICLGGAKNILHWFDAGMIIEGSSRDDIGPACFGKPWQGRAACFAKARGEMIGLRHFIAANIFLTFEPAEVLRCYDDIGGMSTAGDFATTRAMAILKDPQIAADLIADLTA